MKRGILIFIIFILSVATAYAASFDITHEEVVDRISLLEDARVNITINNHDRLSDTYRFSVSNPNWNLFAEDISVKNTGLRVSGNSEKTTTLILKPTPSAPGGRNTITLKIEAEAHEEIQEYEIPIIVRKESYSGYTPAILATVEVPVEIDPRDQFFVMIYLENLNVRTNEMISIKLSSNLFSKEITSSLGPLENKTEEVLIKLDDLTAPTTDKLKTYIDIEGTPFTPDAKEFVILDYTGEFKSSIEETRAFFKTSRDIKFTNNGNKESEQMVKYPVKGLQGIFTTSSPRKDAVIKQEGLKYFAWNAKLAPGESFRVNITTNYRWLIIILAVIVILLIHLRIIKAPVILTKSTKSVERKGGGISEMKATLVLKNNSHKILENVEIRDIIPNIAELKKDFEVGTLAPSRTFKNKSGNTVIKWDINDIDPHEERIISYNIKSKLTILGDFELPVAIIKYRNKKGKEIIVKSNKLLIRSQTSTEQ